MTSLNHRLETPTKKKPISNIHISTLWVIFVRAEQISDEREGGMDGRTNGRTQIPPVFYRTSSPSGPLPKNETNFFKKCKKRFCKMYIFFFLGMAIFYISPFLRPPPCPQALALAPGPWLQPPGPGSSPWALDPTPRS